MRRLEGEGGGEVTECHCHTDCTQRQKNKTRKDYASNTVQEKEGRPTSNFKEKTTLADTTTICDSTAGISPTSH